MRKRITMPITSMTLAILFGLPACSLVCPPPGLGQAAYPSSKPNNGDFIFDRWVANPGAEVFLRDKLQTEGLASLTTKYGMQCIPYASADCPDCSVCSTVFAGKSIGSGQIGFACVDDGWMFVRAQVGPGSRVIAMTYWQTPKEPH